MDARHASSRRGPLQPPDPRARARAKTPAVIEKTPHNVCRIGFLEARPRRPLPEPRPKRPGCRPLHRQDCLPPPFYKIAGKPDYNQWWGTHECKWPPWVDARAAAGYYEEVGPLRAPTSSGGAHEWLVSPPRPTAATAPGPAWLRSPYTALTGKPRETLGFVRSLASRKPIPRGSVRRPIPTPERATHGEQLRLPPGMAAAFNAQQERYGFAGQAWASLTSFSPDLCPQTDA